MRHIHTLKLSYNSSAHVSNYLSYKAEYITLYATRNTNNVYENCYQEMHEYFTTQIGYAYNE